MPPRGRIHDIHERYADLLNDSLRSSEFCEICETVDTGNSPLLPHSVNRVDILWSR